MNSEYEILFEKLKEKFKKIIKSELLNFESVNKKEKVIGVYFVYSEDKEKPIYIGSTNNFHVRFGTDLKDKSTHTLHKKLLNEGRSKEEVKYFLMNQCRYRIEECENKIEAEALEHFAIFNFKPEYNAHVYNSLNKRKDLEEE